MKVSGYHHVNVIVKDVERASSFYRDVLGLEQIDRFDFNFSGAWFKVGEAAELHLMQVDGSVNSGSHHFAVEVEDWDAAMKTIRDAGIEFDVEPNTRPDGSPVAFIRDTEGNRVEIVYHDSWH